MSNFADIRVHAVLYTTASLEETPPKYSTEDPEAWGAIRRMVELRWLVEIAGGPDQWSVVFTWAGHEPYGTLHNPYKGYSTARSFPEAVCTAILHAVSPSAPNITRNSELY